MKAQRPKYYVQYNENWAPGGMSGKDIPKLPIAYALAGFRFGDIAVRPGVVGPKSLGLNTTKGVLFVPAGEVPEKYSVDDDEWSEIPCFGENEFGVRCFMGYPKDTPLPGPRELLRPDVATGPDGIEHPLKIYYLKYSERFADGNVWEVPAARRFDQGKAETEFTVRGGPAELDAVFSSERNGQMEHLFSSVFAGIDVFAPVAETSQVLKDGHWVDGEPRKEYREIWNLALKVDRLLDGTQNDAEAEEIPGIGSDEAKLIAVRVLQVFYNIGPAEASWLQMFTRSLFVYVLMRFCDYESYTGFQQKKIYEALVRATERNVQTPTGTELSSSGSPDASPDTPPPPEN